MKKHMAILPAVLLLLSLVLTAAATGLGPVTLSVQSVSAAPGETVTLEVCVTQNPGFTNLAVRLDYDRDLLTLVAITPGSLASSNAVQTQWTPEGGSTYGYAVFASDTPVTASGVLFTATFAVTEGMEGSAQVYAEVAYARNNEAVFSVFEELTAESAAGLVTVSAPVILPGDISGDGNVTALDLTQMYNALRFDQSLTESQLLAADMNGDGTLTAMDLTILYNLIRFAK